MAERPAVEALADGLQEELGDDLQAVLYYESGGYQLIYVRDDLADEYADAEID